MLYARARQCSCRLGTRARLVGAVHPSSSRSGFADAGDLAEEDASLAHECPTPRSAQRHRSNLEREGRRGRAVRRRLRLAAGQPYVSLRIFRDERNLFDDERFCIIVGTQLSGVRRLSMTRSSSDGGHDVEASLPNLFIGLSAKRHCDERIGRHHTGHISLRIGLHRRRACAMAATAARSDVDHAAHQCRDTVVHLIGDSSWSNTGLRRRFEERSHQRNPRICRRDHCTGRAKAEPLD